MFKNKKSIIEILTIMFVASILVANTVAGRTWKPFPGLDFEVTAAFLFFILPMIIGDVLAEVLPKKQFHKVIIYGFGANLFMVLVYTFVTKLPNSDPFVVDAYNLVLGQSFMIFIGSVTGYVFGSYANALTMWIMKAKHGEKKFVLRAWISTLVGQIVDNSLFLTIALGIGFGLPIEVVAAIFITETSLEILIETLVLPFTSKLVKIYKNLQTE